MLQFEILPKLPRFVKISLQDAKPPGEGQRYWNDLGHEGAGDRTTFVAIYDVFWLSEENRLAGGDVVCVQLFLPTKQLLGLHIRDSKSILRGRL